MNLEAVLQAFWLRGASYKILGRGLGGLVIIKFAKVPMKGTMKALGSCRERNQETAGNRPTCKNSPKFTLWLKTEFVDILPKPATNKQNQNQTFLFQNYL